jgi:lipopolysaccharide export system protein LptA
MQNHSSFRRTPPLRGALAATALAIAVAVVTPPASAEKGDRDKPIFFNGNTAGADFGTKGGELVGNVVITQGTLTIHADRIIFHQNPDNTLSATAYGNPVTFREKRDDSDQYNEGFAQRVVYDGSKRFVELFDRALLKRTGDEIRSNYISYNADTDVFKAEGRPDTAAGNSGDSPLGSRVRGVFQPQTKDKDAKDGKSPKDAKSPAQAPKAPLPLKPDTTLNEKPN